MSIIGLPPDSNEDLKPPEPEPLLRLGRITEHSSLVWANHPDVTATKLEVRIGEGAAKKKLGAKRFAHLQAFKASPRPTKKRYIEPKGVARVGDAFLMDAPRFDSPLYPMPAEADVRESSSPENAADVLPRRGYNDSGQKNAFHSPDLNAALSQDLGADDDRGMARRALSWAYVFTIAFYCELFVRVKKATEAWLKKTQDRIRFKWWLYTRTAESVMGRIRHELMLLRRMGFRPYLRLRKYRKPNARQAPRREVSWSAAAQLRQPDGSYLACVSLTSEFEQRLERTMQAYTGPNPAEAVQAFYQLWALESQYRAAGLEFDPKNTPMVFAAETAILKQQKTAQLDLFNTIDVALRNNRPQDAIQALNKTVEENFPKAVITQNSDGAEMVRCPACNAFDSALSSDRPGRFMCEECGTRFDVEKKETHAEFWAKRTCTTCGKPNKNVARWNDSIETCTCPEPKP